MLVAPLTFERPCLIDEWISFNAFWLREPRRKSPRNVNRHQAADILLGGGANPATFKLPSAICLGNLSCTTFKVSRAGHGVGPGGRVRRERRASTRATSSTAATASSAGKISSRLRSSTARPASSLLQPGGRGRIVIAGGSTPAEVGAHHAHEAVDAAGVFERGHRPVRGQNVDVGVDEPGEQSLTFEVEVVGISDPPTQASPACASCGSGCNPADGCQGGPDCGCS